MRKHIAIFITAILSTIYDIIITFGFSAILTVTFIKVYKIDCPWYILFLITEIVFSNFYDNLCVIKDTYELMEQDGEIVDDESDPDKRD